MADRPDIDSLGSQQSHSYFVPMVDMLAGVVFILIVLLVSANLVSRNDFVTAQKAQSSAAAAPVSEKSPALNLPLDPRRQVELATRMLLDRLSRVLEARGYHVDSNVDEGQLTIAEVDAFGDSQSGLSQHGEALVSTLAEALSAELSCLSGGARTAPHCRDYPDARLETAQIEVVPGSASQADHVLADSRALSVMSGTIARQPNLLALRSPGGVGLFTYAVAAPDPLPAINLRFQFADKAKGK